MADPVAATIMRLKNIQLKTLKSIAELHAAGTAANPAHEGGPLDAIYPGAKASLRPVHEAVIAVIRDFGAFEEAPKQAYDAAG
jgi:hypothetical protein